MSNSKPSRKSRSPVPSQPGARRANIRSVGPASSPPTVSVRWLLGGLATALAAALVCAWLTLCILFWQGSWQLVYHPTSAVTRTPASANLSYEAVGFASNAAGEPELRGWWIPAASPARYTAIYLHGAAGNLGDTVSALVTLHAAGVNIFAFDYRGYGQSRFVHPSERRWREDADSALRYLTGTRHIPVKSIILVGKNLGANLAIEMAAGYPNLAGIVLEQPLESPTSAIFNDARAHLVPAHLLVSDRWETNRAASNLLISSLWFYWNSSGTPGHDTDQPLAYQKAPARKMLVWLTASPDAAQQFSAALSSWLDQLPNQTR